MTSPSQSDSQDQTFLSKTPVLPQPEDPLSQSQCQSSKTLTLESPISVNPDHHQNNQDPGNRQNPLDLDQNDDEDDDPEDLSAPSPRTSEPDPRPSPAVAALASPGITSVYRRGTKRKMGNKRKAAKGAKGKKSLQKLEVLKESLKPIPFVPVKSLDFSSHEKLLKGLGLWDFVHLEFDQVIQADLLAQLIVNFDPPHRCSHVNGIRLLVNRADLARALKLPVKKLTASDGAEAMPEATEESVGFLENFVSNWLLLHDDTWMMPNEVLNWTKAIKDGSFEKLDWAKMIWFMIEKELMQAPVLSDCYYASHLQLLIKSQRKELLSSELPKVENEVDLEGVDGIKEEEGDHEGDVKMSGEGDGDHKEDVKMSGEGDGDHKEDVKMSGEGDLCGQGMEELGQELEERVQELEESGDELQEHGHEVRQSQVLELGLELEERVQELEESGDEFQEHGHEVRQSQVLELGLELEERVQELEESGDELQEHGQEVRQSQVLEESIQVLEESRQVLEEKGHELEEHNIELSLGQDNMVEKADAGKVQVADVSMMDFEECKEEEPGQWFMGGKNNMSEFLRQCNHSERKEELDVEDEGKHEEYDLESGQDEEHQDVVEPDEDDEEEEEMEEQGEQDGCFHFSPKSMGMDCLPSGSLIQSMEAADISLNSGMPHRDPLAEDFIPPRDDTPMASHFGNGSKRELGMMNDSSHHPHNANKRLRMDSSWDDSKPSSDVDSYLDQMIQFSVKVKGICAVKEQALQEANMNSHMLMEELQKRENLVQHLKQVNYEEEQRRRIEIYRLERELYLMSNIVDGYKKALKETHRAFAAYRERCPQLDEPLYKDVPGSGGLVLSTTELEKLRVKQEEEEKRIRLEIERKIINFEECWSCQFSRNVESFDVVANKLLSLENEMELLKGSFASSRKSETSKPARNDLEPILNDSELAPESAQRDLEPAPEAVQMDSDFALEVMERPQDSEHAPMDTEPAQIDSELAPEPAQIDSELALEPAQDES